MTEFNDLIKMLNVSNLNLPEKNTQPEQVIQNEVFSQDNPQILPDLPINYEPFNIDVFINEIYERSNSKNQLYREIVQNISAYDISSGCIRDIVYKLTNTPVESFADKWLPILMRSVIGNAIHEFIQNHSRQFTEREVSLKIPSIRFSGRLDNTIGPEQLIEIKSLPYSDYEKVIKTRKPRVSDFYQSMTYKYILENHLAEAKDPNIKIRKGSHKPKFDKYNIKKIQFIYIAHDVTATDVDSFAEILQRIKDLKRLLNSKSNSFFFITTLVVDVDNNIAKPYIDYVENKIKTINKYLDTNTLPDFNDPFVDTKACFFCMYKQLCNPKK